ncbi:MAG: arsenate reductase ArsC [Bacteroidota bacterium]
MYDQTTRPVTTVKKQVLVLCTGNSCRSQMAEGWLRYFAGEKAEVFSAGIESHGLNPRAVAVMKEVDIDISHHTSKTIEDLGPKEFDIVITVCDNARERCPYFPARVLQLHQDFQDPAKATGSKEEVLSVFRSVRDQIRVYCQGFVINHLK